MNQEFICPNCDNKFKAKSINECPVCAQQNAMLLTRPTVFGIRDDSEPEFLEQGEPENQQQKKLSSRPDTVIKQESISQRKIVNSDLVEAQNRTTHAIRALAVFFFTSLRTGISGSTVFGLGYLCLTNKDFTGFGVFLMFVGWAIAFFGFFYAVYSGMTELNKSKID
jgi:hypothetical protein